MKKKIVIFLFIFFIIPSYVIFGIISSTEIIGFSLNKNKIELYKFGKGKNILLIIAGIHGNEENTSKTAFEIIDLLNNNKINIPQDKSIWIIPKANPDGLARGRRLNNNDVDLNRNFNTDNWKSSFYLFNILLSAGKHPFSEPESITLKNFFESFDLKFNKVIVLSLHSRGDLIIPGNRSLANNKLINLIKNYSSYKVGDIGYAASGDLTGWLSNKLSIPSATIEFKSKKNIETDEIEKIILGLFKINFSKEIYKYPVNLSQAEFTAENINKLIKNLPEKIKTNITSSENNINEFLKLFQAIQNDEELLLLVNKRSYLPENYQPNDLVEINNSLTANKKKLILRKIILPDLIKMFGDAASEKIYLKIISAYRSYEEQKNVYLQWIKILGEEEAKRVSAVPGASQHQLGTTVDINSLDISFAKTKEGKWLNENAYKYGFIMSYPEGQEDLTGYRFEPWHYRYIGKDASILVYKYFDNLLELFLNWYWDFKVEK